jgi:glycosyltransferase involved in cell wall biosynthesis
MSDPEAPKRRKRKPRILITQNDPAPFVDRDAEILAKHFQVQSFLFRGKRSVPALAAHVARSKAVFSWSALGNATTAVLLSRIMRKKSLVVAGGWDVFYLPEIDYGAMKSKKRIRRTTYALKHADRVLAVSEFAKKGVLDWIDRDVDVVYNSVDTEKFRPSGEQKNLVITVAGINNLVRMKIKGLETFLEAARRMDDTEFGVSGRNSPEWDKKLREEAPKNTRIIGWSSQDELLSYYQEAKVYAQLSYHESFGVSLAEGMACGCVPVAANRSALPEVVGDTGFYVEYGDVDGTVEALHKALQSTRSQDCRNRVKNLFSSGIREDKLVRIVNEELHR